MLSSSLGSALHQTMMPCVERLCGPADTSVSAGRVSGALVDCLDLRNSEVCMTRSGLPVSLPPDPNTRAPGWTLPKGACDTHAHVFGPPDIFPYYDERRYTPPAAPIEHYRNMQRITGLSRAVFFCPTAHGYDNRVILDAIAKLGDSARGIANINSSFDTKLLQALAEGGIRGARFHLMKDRPGGEDHLSEQLPVLQRFSW